MSQNSINTSVDQSIKIIDSHCHIHFENFTEDLDNIIQNAKYNSVIKMITVGTEIDSHEKILPIIDKYDNVFGTVGIHPSSTQKIFREYGKNFEDIIYEYLIEYGQHKKIVGLGETGLDLYVESNCDLINQEKSFIAHIEASKTLQLPIIIHTRSAEADTIRILKQNTANSGVFHCFTGSQPLANQAIDMGFFISFSGICTFKSTHEIRDIIRNTPLNRILVETDSPYLSPEPVRKIKRNEPAHSLHILEKISEIHQISLNEAADRIFHNTHQLFKKLN
ncbi:TatD family hydrolase [Candidatus Gromoviella agglomerans]|uniref:TatD family hydrolase n=1 Tax=Candidatus Gromoviella agglomerans TaxID=2806609 RepID=UPI001E2F8094|nr:TatD family hydrolase [Candidatus Gromoviella agglomerans]UFX98582.1 Putative deoxyribonuclease YcfH [Candidatus Gromoviella agglomerans]